MQPGPRNALTDVAGLLVGQAQDAALASGVTVVLCEHATIAGVDVRGGGPGTQETDLLDPERTVERVDAIVLSGGSVFGLDAASGVRALLAERGRGYAVREVRVPIVPSAVLFDLLNGGDKHWGRFSPYRDLGVAAVEAAGPDIALGTVGAGYGATTATLKGGIGTASAVVEGITVGALAAVNAAGSATLGRGPHFWAAPFELGEEFGGLGLPQHSLEHEHRLPLKGAPPLASTTLAVVATDAELSKNEARRLAVMAQDGLARALRPVHTPLDGDAVFSLATGRVPLHDRMHGFARLGDAAATTLARAVARAVYEATALSFAGALPAWRDLFGRNRSAR